MKDNLAYLRHIFEAIGKTEEYIRDTPYEDFTKNTMMVDAVVRELTIIGEAAAHVSDDFREQHPEILFHEITGMRNRIIHEYFTVDLKTVWDTCQVNLPELKKTLEHALRAP